MKPHLQIALAIIWREGEILVSRRLDSADHLPGAWEFPGGKIEVGETPAQAAIREACEEVGLLVEVTAARSPIEWEYEQRIVTLHPFDCRIIGGHLETRRVAEVRCMAPSELRTEDYPAANAQLIADLQRATQSR